MRLIFSSVVAVSIALGMASPVLSQPGNDPFLANPVRSSSSEDLKLRRQIADLKNELSQLKKGLLYKDAESSQWKKDASAKIVHMESQAQQMNKELEELSAIHQRFISHLLLSENETSRLAALTYMYDLRQIGGESGLTPFRLDLQSVEALKALTLSGDAKRRHLAKSALAAFAPNAIELGFQKVADQWAPLEPEPSARIRRLLNSSRASFAYDEIAMSDIVQQLMVSHNFGIKMESGSAKNQLVTFSGSGESLSDALNSILVSIGLSYRIRNGFLEILPTDHADLPASLTYNVRGLLTEKLGIEEVKQLVEDRFGPISMKTKANVLDEYRLLVIASDYQQNQVAQFLATLAKGN